MINTQTLIDQLDNIKINKPVYIMVMDGLHQIKKYEVEATGTAYVFDKGNGAPEKSIMIIALCLPQIEGLSSFDLNTLRERALEYKNQGYDTVQVYVDEMEASVYIENMIERDTEYLFIININELIQSKTNCLN
jgi:hypothetical protein